MKKEILRDGLGNLDFQFSKMVHSTIDFWHNAGFTPNMLTTLGASSIAAGVYFLYKKKIVLTCICILLHMYFDYADGIMARKYNQMTEFGDFYDHVTDLIARAGLLSVLAIHGAYVQFGLLLTLSVLSTIRIGCIEKETESKGKNDKQAASLSIVYQIRKSMCFSPLNFNGVTITGAIILILLFSKL